MINQSVYSYAKPDFTDGSVFIWLAHTKTSEKVSQPVFYYRILGHGNNYSGTWSHPLTPYKWNPEKPQEKYFSGKGQPGGITYKTWDNLTYSNDCHGQYCAAVIKHFYTLLELFSYLQRQVPRLWVFGYDRHKKSKGRLLVLRGNAVVCCTGPSTGKNNKRDQAVTGAHKQCAVALPKTN